MTRPGPGYRSFRICTNDFRRMNTVRIDGRTVPLRTRTHRRDVAPNQRLQIDGTTASLRWNAIIVRGVRTRDSQSRPTSVMCLRVLLSFLRCSRSQNGFPTTPSSVAAAGHLSFGSRRGGYFWPGRRALARFRHGSRVRDSRKKRKKKHYNHYYNNSNNKQTWIKRKDENVF